ncbi:hypothetical protein CsSME_00043617 [Camellia sinensis var. sinensis]
MPIPLQLLPPQTQTQTLTLTLTLTLLPSLNPSPKPIPKPSTASLLSKLPPHSLPTSPPHRSAATNLRLRPPLLREAPLPPNPQSQSLQSPPQEPEFPISPTRLPQISREMPLLHGHRPLCLGPHLRHVLPAPHLRSLLRSLSCFRLPIEPHQYPFPRYPKIDHSLPDS